MQYNCEKADKLNLIGTLPPNFSLVISSKFISMKFITHNNGTQWGGGCCDVIQLERTKCFESVAMKYSLKLLRQTTLRSVN